MLVLDVGMQVVVCVKALAVGALRQAVPKVAAEMRCLRCSLDSPQLLVLYSHSLHAQMQRLLPTPGTTRDGFDPVSSCPIHRKTLICHFLVANSSVLASR